MIKRRSLAYVMAAFVLVSSSFYPQREAKAFVPAIPIVMALVNAAGAVLASDLLTVAGMHVLGGMAVAAIFSIPGDSSSVSVAVPLVADPAKTAVAIPAPSAPATATASGGGSTTEYAAGDNSWGDLAHACAVYGANPPANLGYGGTRTYQCLGTGTNYFIAGYTDTYSGVATVGAPTNVYPVTRVTTTPVTCPPGYSVSGSGCVLTSPRQATSDKRADLVPCPGGTGLCWTPDKDSPPNNASASDPSCNGCGKIWGKNANGDPFVTTITPRADGGSDIRTDTQVASSSGSAIRSDTMTTSSAGTITSAGSTVSAGTISDTGTVGVAPTVATTAPTSTTQPIVFPSDYARTGEAAAAASGITSAVNSLSPKLDTLHNDLTQTSTPATDPVIPGGSAFDDAFFKGTFTNLLAWQMPGHQSQCFAPVFDYNLFGAHFHYVMDAHCTIAEQYRGVISTMFVALWVIVALFIVIGA